MGLSHTTQQSTQVEFVPSLTTVVEDLAPLDAAFHPVIFIGNAKEPFGHGPEQVR